MTRLWRKKPIGILRKRPYNIGGAFKKARANATRCFSPPLNCQKKQPFAPNKISRNPPTGFVHGYSMTHFSTLQMWRSNIPVWDKIVSRKEQLQAVVADLQASFSNTSFILVRELHDNFMNGCLLCCFNYLFNCTRYQDLKTLPIKR